MRVAALDHVNIIASDVESSARPEAPRHYDRETRPGPTGALHHFFGE